MQCRKKNLVKDTDNFDNALVPESVEELLETS